MTGIAPMKRQRLKEREQNSFYTPSRSNQMEGGWGWERLLIFLRVVDLGGNNISGCQSNLLAQQKAFLLLSPIPPPTPIPLPSPKKCLCKIATIVTMLPLCRKETEKTTTHDFHNSVQFYILTLQPLLQIFYTIQFHKNESIFLMASSVKEQDEESPMS